MSRSSISFLLENVSNVEPCNRFNSSISLEVLASVPRIVHEEVVDLVEVVRLLEEHD